MYVCAYHGSDTTNKLKQNKLEYAQIQRVTSICTRWCGDGGAHNTPNWNCELVTLACLHTNKQTNPLASQQLMNFHFQQHKVKLSFHTRRWWQRLPQQQQQQHQQQHCTNKSVVAVVFFVFISFHDAVDNFDAIIAQLKGSCLPNRVWCYLSVVGDNDVNYYILMFFYVSLFVLFFDFSDSAITTMWWK